MIYDWVLQLVACAVISGGAYLALDLFFGGYRGR